MGGTPKDHENGASEKSSRHHHHHHHHGHHHGVNLAHEFNRAGQFFRPNGRKIHVASSPAEVDPLRRKLSTVEPQQDFDIVIHGSADHVSFLVLWQALAVNKNGL